MCPNGEQEWMMSTQLFIDTVLINFTWELVPLPPRQKIVKSKWVFKIKTKMDGTLEQYKARLVVKGFTHVHGFDYDETFSLVIKHDSIQSIFARVATHDMHMIQYDVRTTFLYE
jgi:hypothetical protein